MSKSPLRAVIGFRIRIKTERAAVRRRLAAKLADLDVIDIVSSKGVVEDNLHAVLRVEPLVDGSGGRLGCDRDQRAVDRPVD